MKDIKKIDDELYKYTYIEKDATKANELWQKIRKDKTLLNDAIKVVKDKFNEKDTLKALAIADRILISYDEVDKTIYNKLIDIIYSNINIARIVLDGYSNGGYSFLLMSLWNEDLVLNREKKVFAVYEAMHKTGSKKDVKESNDYLKEYNNDYIGLYFNNLVKSLSTVNAHGRGAFDIRYYILRNKNWSKEEKEKLIYDFYQNDELYEALLEEWEFSLLNELSTEATSIYMEDLLYLKEEYLKKYFDKETTKKIMDEISFLKLMHEIRPQKWEKEFSKQLKM